MKKTFFAFLFVAMIIAISSFAKVTGNGNVSTINFTVKPDDWKPVGESGTAGSYVFFRYNSEALTKKIFDNAMVMVYVLGTSGGGWYPLPHSYYNSGIEITTTFDYQTGYVELRTYTPKNDTSPFNSEIQYKLVITE